MKGRLLVILAVGIIANSAHAQDSTLPAPSDEVLDNLEGWPVTGYTSEQLASFRLKRDQDRCLDLSEVILPAVVGASENYINGCLADLVSTQMLLSQKSQTNIQYSPKFATFYYSTGVTDEVVKFTTSAIEAHCTKMGEKIRWFTACGAPEHYNACLKTFAWYFTEYLSQSLSKDVAVPYVDLPKSCPGGPEEPTGPTETQKKCIATAQESLLKKENKCVNKSPASKTPLCVFYRQRDACRARIDKEAEALSRTCGYPVSLVRTADVAPKECEQCNEKMNKVLLDILNLTAPKVCASKCDRWRYKNALKNRAQEKSKQFRDICGDITRFIKAGIMIIESAPAKCNEEKADDCVTRAKA